MQLMVAILQWVSMGVMCKRAYRTGSPQSHQFGLSVVDIHTKSSHPVQMIHIVMRVVCKWQMTCA